MCPEFKVKWIEALRSGKYIQHRGGLNVKGKGLCCLGVACDISGKGNWIDTGIKGVSKRYNCYGDLAITRLPNILAKEIQITFDQQTTLMVMNDSLDKDFTQIADYIEQNL